jgi:hypothetical protein
MSSTHVNRTIPEVFSDLVGQLTTLLRKEGQLARTEVGDKLVQIATGLGLAMVGAVLAIPALVVLLEAVVALLVRAGLAIYLSALIVGGAALIAGIVLMITGMGRLKSENLVPSKTIHQLQRDVEVAKHEASDSNDLHRAA